MFEIRISRYGGPEVLECVPKPKVQLAPDDIAIAVSCAGVNFADVMARMGLYPDAPRPPLVPGYEVAGVVDEVGPGVSSVRPGDRVVALTRFGGYATHVVVPAPYVFPIAATISDLRAAALPVNYLTASLALYRLANLAPGETVLIHGVGGGVGIAATQLAKLRQATVIGTAGPDKHKALSGLGVDHLVDSRQGLDSIFNAVRQLSGKRGVDVILDPVGGRSFRLSYQLLAPLGRLVLYGVSAIAPGERRSWWRAAQTIIRMPRFKPLSLMNRNKGIFGLNLAHLWDERDQLARVMRELLGDLEAGRIQPAIARTFDLERASDAHRFIQSRVNVGKVILTTARLTAARG